VLGLVTAPSENDSACRIRTEENEAGLHFSLSAENGKADMNDYHGRFVRYELMTINVTAAKAFYTKVVGWGTKDAFTSDQPHKLLTIGSAFAGGVTGLSRRRGACLSSAHAWAHSFGRMRLRPSSHGFQHCASGRRSRVTNSRAGIRHRSPRSPMCDRSRPALSQFTDSP
jgi:hypothetical protein